jgi:D-beta-D-heptose 7-phosphate kinase / D-beta-D-heptose 1-phosphate adenosyltransferase
MSDGNLVPLVEGLSQATVVCVGDVMLDRYVYGQVDRVSPEAPIPVLGVERDEASLGGAGNVLRNLATLGARGRLVSVTGADAAAEEIGRLLGALGEGGSRILTDPERTTTVKTRYIAGTQQLLRADHERIAPLGPNLREKLLATMKEVLRDGRVTIVSDYAKGVLGDGLVGEIIGLARRSRHIVAVDPKGVDYAKYKGADIIKPNRRELALATGRRVDSELEIIEAGRALIEAHGFGAVLVSLSERGMLLVEASGDSHRLPAMAREVYDVSGAGDTVMAVLGASLGAGASLLDAARLANIAAGIVVGKVGTAAVHSRELIETLIDRDQAAAEKSVPLPLALEHVARWRRNGLRIGFTNGVFDLLHPGHVSLLRQAKARCDRLIVGINSDASTRRLKGPTRPVNPEDARAAVLAAVGSVDLVVIFEADTPLSLIAAIKPDCLVKGADYRIDQVVGADLVRSYGGEVTLADLSDDSTTATIARMATRQGLA